MAAKSDYLTGTITLANGSTAFTGTGTAWQASGFAEGDQILQVAGQTQWDAMVATITSNTSGTLVRPWGGATGTYAYRMRYQADGQRVTAQARNLVELLGNGNLLALAGLAGAANLMPVFTGPGTMDALTAAQVRTLLALVVGTNVQAFNAKLAAIAGLTGAAGSFIRFTGANTAAMQAIVGTVSAAGGVTTGAHFESGSNANGEFLRFADGTQFCWSNIAVSYYNATTLRGNWPFPAAFLAGSIPRVAFTPSLFTETGAVDWVLAGSGASLGKLGMFGVGAAIGAVGANVDGTFDGTSFVAGNHIRAESVAFGRWR